MTVERGSRDIAQLFHRLRR